MRISAGKSAVARGRILDFGFGFWIGMPNRIQDQMCGLWTSNSSRAEPAGGIAHFSSCRGFAEDEDGPDDWQATVELRNIGRANYRAACRGNPQPT